MNNVKTPYHILVIEDNILDFIIVEDLLTERIHDPVVLFHAVNFKDACTMLKTNDLKFDAVLLDLTLPDKTGQDLIREILIIADSSPVIILTGYGDIAFSIISISIGVSDYLIKDDLTASELYKSILYSIERKKTTSLLEESERKYISLFNLSPQPMWVFSLSTSKFLDVNIAAIRKYGYDKQEFLLMKIDDLNSSDSHRGSDDRKVNRMGGTRLNYCGNLMHQKKNGDLMSIEYYGNNILFKGEKAEIGISVDVTEKSTYIETIQNQNNKLREIAWIQSHIVRAPLARMMGIADLIKDLNLVDDGVIELMNELLNSASELDGVIRKVAANIEN